MEAAENNHLETVKYLIKAGALVDPKVAVYALSFFPEEASVHHFFLDKVLNLGWSAQAAGKWTCLSWEWRLDKAVVVSSIILMVQCPGCDQFGASAATCYISLWHQM